MVLRNKRFTCPESNLKFYTIPQILRHILITSKMNKPTQFARRESDIKWTEWRLCFSQCVRRLDCFIFFAGFADLSFKMKARGFTAPHGDSTIYGRFLCIHITPSYLAGLRPSTCWYVVRSREYSCIMFWITSPYHHLSIPLIKLDINLAVF